MRWGSALFLFNEFLFNCEQRPEKLLRACLQTFAHILSSVSEDNMPSSSQVSSTALSAEGGHSNKPNDPSAAGADDRPDVGLQNCIQACVFSIKQALVGRSCGKKSQKT